MGRGKQGLAQFLFLGVFIITTTVFAQERGETSWAASVTPTLSYRRVTGDEEKYQEDWWVPGGWSGGLAEFTFKDTKKSQTSLSLEGRVIVPGEDLKLKLEIARPDVGFLRGGYTERRKYFDGTGGSYLPFDILPFELGKDLHLDIGHYYFQAGLTIPDLPNIIATYEHQYKDGNKSSTIWGGITLGGITRKIFPAYKDIDEEADIFKFEIDHTIGKVHMGDSLQYERNSTNITGFEEERNLDLGTAETVTVEENYSHDALFNTLHLESQISEKVYCSLGYLYTRLNGDAGLRLRTVPFGPDPFDKDWLTRLVGLDQDAHVVNGSIHAGPYANVAFFGGIQAETTKTAGDAEAVLTETSFGGEVGEVASPEAVIFSRSKKDGIEETAGIRFTGLPFTTAYVEGKWVQNEIDLSEEELEDGILSFERHTDTDVDRERYTIGINTSPLRNATFSIRYRKSLRNNGYNHVTDTTPGYSAFITDQTLDKDDISARLILRPVSLVQVSLSWHSLVMDIDTRSDTSPPSSVKSGEYDADIYDLSITLTPGSRLYFTGLLSYQDAKNTSFDNDILSVLTYDGGVITFLGTTGLSIDKKTSLTAEYLYSRSYNFEDNSADGLPLGLNNKRYGLVASLSRDFSKTARVRLQYGYYDYDEESNQDADDYKAHLFGASLAFSF